MFKSSTWFKSLLILREAFLTLIPVVIIMNSLVMLGALTELLARWGIPIPDIGSDALARLYFLLAPLFVSLSLSTLLAKEKGLDPAGTVLIALVCFLRGTNFLGISQTAEITSYQGSVLASVPVTWIAVRLLHYFSTQSRLQIVSDRSPHRSELSPRLVSTLNLIGPGLITVFCIELSRELIGMLGAIAPLPQELLQSQHINPLPELILYKAIALCAWVVGFHGDYSATGVFRFLYNTPIGDATAIQLKTFHAIFMNMGGAGCTLPVPFIILCSKRLAKFRAIAKLSLPFAIVNINETLLFGIPILLNPIFLVPFFSTAFVNMAIALTAIHFNLFSIDPAPVDWVLPAFYQAYVASDGSIWAILTQLICLVVDGCIYYPFLIIAAQRYEASKALSQLFKENNDSFIAEALSQRQEAAFLIHQSATLKETAACQNLLSQLSKGHFLLYYQPKLNARTLDIVGLEALLRFQDHQGNIIPPTFLPTLYRQGLSKTIDQKVVNLIFDQLRYWQASKTVIPAIALNFDKDFLLDAPSVKAFIQRARSHNICFCIEITEHTYAKESQALAAVAHQLRAAGHRISIDDFGTGYSSLTSLVSLEADEIKLDRALAVPPTHAAERGTTLLSYSIQLCHELGFSVVAEGIETKAQLHLAQRCAVDSRSGLPPRLPHERRPNQPPALSTNSPS